MLTLHTMQLSVPNGCRLGCLFHSAGLKALCLNEMETYNGLKFVRDETVSKTIQTVDILLDSPNMYMDNVVRFLDCC